LETQEDWCDSDTATIPLNPIEEDET